MPAPTPAPVTYIALKQHHDMKSGRYLKPDDEIEATDDLVKIFPGKFKIKETPKAKPEGGTKPPSKSEIPADK